MLLSDAVIDLITFQMMMMITRVLLLLSVASCVIADIYLHVPRGSNNRLNEKSANRKNPNRLFDSQVIKIIYVFLWVLSTQCETIVNNLSHARTHAHTRTHTERELV